MLMELLKTSKSFGKLWTLTTITLLGQLMRTTKRTFKRSSKNFMTREISTRANTRDIIVNLVSPSGLKLN